MTSRPSLILRTLPLALAIQSADAVDYTTNGGDATNGATWTPDASGIISGGSITPLAGDRLIINGGNLSGGPIVLNTGAQLTQAAGGQHLVPNRLDIAGTGVDGNGVIQNNGNDWINASNVRLTGDATIRVNTGGWRHDAHGSPNNVFNLNGNTLTVTGGNNWYFVNTSVQGPGVINANIGGEFNFEAAAVLPADVTLNLTNTRSSSWDGANRVMAGPVNLNNGIIETRFNDANKTYSGPVSLTNTGTFRTSDNGGGGGSQNITGQISGTGRLVKDGAMVNGTVTLANSGNNYSGGTEVQTGILRVGATNAVSTAGPINVNAGATLDLGTFNQDMTGGTINGAVTGSGTLRLTGTGSKEIGLGATIAGNVEFAGGTVRSWDLDRIGGTINVSADTTLRPQSAAGLAEFNRVGGDANVFLNTDTGVSGATFRGIRGGIDAIDSTAKPFGDNNRWIYSGEIVNNTGSPMTVTFAEQYDDAARVKVNGTTVLLDGGWNAPTKSGDVVLQPGSNQIEISTFDGVGGAGPNSGWDKGVGIRQGSYPTSPPVNGDFGRVANGQLPAGLSLTTGATDGKNIDVAGGVTLTVDTSDVVGGTYTMTGSISGAGGLAKTGAGTLRLTGISTYSGQTIVNQGTLVLAPGASLNPSSVINVAAGATFDARAAGGITVPFGQTLSGNGTLLGDVTVNGTASPGNSIGSLNIVGDLFLAGITLMEIDRNAAPLNADLFTATGDLAYGGTLNVVNLGAPLEYGDTFNLFDWGTISGNVSGMFASLNLPALPAGLDWTNRLSIDGTLVVTPEPSTTLINGLLVGGAGALVMRRRRRLG